MSAPLKFIMGVAICALTVAAIIAALLAVVWSGLPTGQQAVLAAIATERLGALIFVSLIALAALGILLHAAFQSYVAAPRRVTEQVRLILDANPGHRIERSGPEELAELAAAINALADRVETLQKDVDLKVADASASVHQERNRLAALMSELGESVIVCNAGGTILLYNQRARQLFSAPDPRDGSKEGSDLVGLGRSLFAVIDRDVISHGLAHIHYRLQQGDRLPFHVFVTATRGGQLIRARMAPVLGGMSLEHSADVSGFVLVLDDVRRDVELASLRDRLLRSLTERTRSSLASIRAAVENLVSYPQMEASRHQQFLGIIRDDAERLGRELEESLAAQADQLASEWPLATTHGRDLLWVLRRSLESRLGGAVALDEGEQPVWLSVDSFLLAEALSSLAGRLQSEMRVREFVLRLSRSGSRIRLDLCWHNGALAVETALSWQHEPIAIPGQPQALSFKDIVERHGGEAWYQAKAETGTASFSALLPAAAEEAGAGVATQASSRPTYYDFDLFHQPGQNAALDQRPLSELSYTVFDTETTGLEPSKGDEIIAIGAVRIVNGRLLTAEVFDQLVNPRRDIPGASARVHGITNAMLRNQAPIERVLPAFYRFSEGTVLVAHNAAFDMRFLQLKEAASGLTFSHPVLDTLMLSAVLHANQTDHTLEAIAARFGVNVIGRHTALGDAIVTGEIFLKMIPLLRERGILTLGQAREAEQKTPYARLGY